MSNANYCHYTKENYPPITFLRVELEKPINFLI